jgi:hypothetical protein
VDVLVNAEHRCGLVGTALGEWDAGFFDAYSGYRVTLTYNLFLRRARGRIATSLPGSKRSTQGSSLQATRYLSQVHGP